MEDVQFKEIEIPEQVGNPAKRYWDALAKALKKAPGAVECERENIQGIVAAMHHRGLKVKCQRLAHNKIAVWKE